MQGLNALALWLAVANLAIYFGNIWVGVVLHYALNTKFEAAYPNQIVNQNVAQSVTAGQIPMKLVLEIIFVAVLLGVSWYNSGQAAKNGNSVSDLA